MLTGEFKHTMDAKGRVFVPAKFRNDLGGSVVILKGFGKFLLMFSEEEYEIFLDKIGEIAATRDNMTDFMREISLNSNPTDIDAQGRINISEEHRKAIGLTKEISFVGMRKHVEIWCSDMVADKKESIDIEKYREISRELRLGLC